MSSDGALYGTTRYGGTSNAGTVFKIDGTGSFAYLHAFDISDGAGPRAALAEGPGGVLYGTTEAGGLYGKGTLYRIESTGTFASIHSFNTVSIPSYCGNAPSPLVRGTDHGLYGTTSCGGIAGPVDDLGTVFKVDTSGNFVLVHAFQPSDGSNYPLGPLTLGSDGMLYGTSGKYGTNEAETAFGSLYKVDNDGAVTTLHQFMPWVQGDGRDPSPVLVQGSDGAIYGTTRLGGSVDYVGSVFRVDIAGAFQSLHTFTTLTDGRDVPSPLVVGSDGALYGTASAGGMGGLGTVFRIDNSGQFAVLHSFSGIDGSAPRAPLVLGPDSALYGTTSGGGAFGGGTVFRIDSAGTFASLDSFDPTKDGARPTKALVVGSNGLLYGAAADGGPEGGGVVFVVAEPEDRDGDGARDSSDNCPGIPNARQDDVDSDLVGDACDNCVAIPNPAMPGGWLASNPWAVLTGGQRDDDFDGHGNACDAKFPGSLGALVGAGDLAQFRASNGKNRSAATCGISGTLPCAIFDLDETATLIGAGDLARFRLLNGRAPGPKCTACPLSCEAGALRSCEP